MSDAHGETDDSLSTLRLVGEGYAKGRAERP